LKESWEDLIKRLGGYFSTDEKVSRWDRGRHEHFEGVQERITLNNMAFSLADLGHDYSGLRKTWRITEQS
jgi:hypothetical protein